jgi:alpha-L-fucosidase
LRLDRRSFLKAAATAAISTNSFSLRTLTGDADRMRWYREAKFGMFIHWGPYSVAGVEASWPILEPNGEITEKDYRALSTQFNPTHFDPHAWIALAQSAGQRYMVFTTKHHDGFCMFDSEYTNYKITRTPYGKDIVRELTEACPREQMPIGFYYSPPDMNHPAYRDTSKLSATNYRGEPERPEWPLYLEYMGLQLDELLTRYGSVATLWFDAVDIRTQGRYDGQRFINQVSRLQPATLINNRLGIPGDFATPEQFIPKSIPIKGIRLDSPDHSEADKMAVAVPRPEDFQPWESCMTINDTWAYRPKDHNFKSPDSLIRSLIEIISRGGNFLLDVGPQPDGQIQPEFVERLQRVGAWVHRNGVAIYGSTYGPIQGQASYRTTANGKSIFVFVLDTAIQEVKMNAPAWPVKQVRLLGEEEPLLFDADAGGIRIPLTKSIWEHGIPVLEIR